MLWTSVESLLSVLRVFISLVCAARCSGDPTVCERDSASLSLVGCLLEEKGIDYSTLHLNDNSCVGQVDEQTHMVTFSFDGSDSCGTVVSVGSLHPHSLL